MRRLRPLLLQPGGFEGLGAVGVGRASTIFPSRKVQTWKKRFQTSESLSASRPRRELR